LPFFPDQSEKYHNSTLIVSFKKNNYPSKRLAPIIALNGKACLVQPVKQPIYGSLMTKIDSPPVSLRTR
jgi:hypothetical protein